MQTHSSRGPRCWKTRSQAARGRGWSDPAAKGRVSGSGLRGGGRTTCRSNCGGRGGGAGPRGQLSSGPPLPGRIARLPPRFSFSPELPRAGRRPLRASPGASSSLSDVPDESESESESEDDEEVSGTRSSSWHIRLKRSSFSLCGEGDGTAGPSAEAIGGFGFCRETGKTVLGPRVHVPNHSPKRSQQRINSPGRHSLSSWWFPDYPSLDFSFLIYSVKPLFKVQRAWCAKCWLAFSILGRRRNLLDHLQHGTARLDKPSVGTAITPVLV